MIQQEPGRELDSWHHPVNKIWEDISRPIILWEIQWEYFQELYAALDEKNPFFTTFFPLGFNSAIGNSDNYIIWWVGAGFLLLQNLEPQLVCDLYFLREAGWKLKWGRVEAVSGLRHSSKLSRSEVEHRHGPDLPGSALHSVRRSVWR